MVLDYYEYHNATSCKCNFDCSVGVLHKAVQHLYKWGVALFVHGRRKKGPCTHHLHILSSPTISGYLEISINLLCYTNILNFSHIKYAYHWPHSVLTMTRERWQHLAVCLQELSMRLSIPAKCCGTWLTFFLWSSPVASTETMQTFTVKGILFLMSKSFTCVSPCSAKWLHNLLVDLSDFGSSL